MASKSANGTKTSPTRLRQIALVAKELERSKDLLTRILGTEVVYIDPQVNQWGLKNILVAIGGDLLEVVSPFKEGTTAGRLLARRGDGGYMIIMQTADAVSRREHIEQHKLAKVITNHSEDDHTMVQYHPKGIMGGMMPELDSHTPSSSNPDPLGNPYSPWHACGRDYQAYSAGMKRCSHLKYIGATLRLAPNETDTERAAEQWETIFGVQRSGNELVFTNASLKFVEGRPGQSEGLESITIEVSGRQRLEEMLDVARREGVCEDGWINLLGVRWHFVLKEENNKATSKL